MGDANDRIESLEESEVYDAAAWYLPYGTPYRCVVVDREGVWWCTVDMVKLRLRAGDVQTALLELSPFWFRVVLLTFVAACKRDTLLLIHFFSPSLPTAAQRQQRAIPWRKTSYDDGTLRMSTMIQPRSTAVAEILNYHPQQMKIMSVHLMKESMPAQILTTMSPTFPIQAISPQIHYLQMRKSKN